MSRRNKKVFKLFLKTGKELAVLRSNGKLFETSGAATEKQCSPNTVLQNSTERRCCVDYGSHHLITVFMCLCFYALYFMLCW